MVGTVISYPRRTVFVRVGSIIIYTGNCNRRSPVRSCMGARAATALCRAHLSAPLPRPIPRIRVGLDADLRPPAQIPRAPHTLVQRFHRSHCEAKPTVDFCLARRGSMQYAAEVSERFHYVNILACHRQRINSSFQDIPECLDLSFDPRDMQSQWFRYRYIHLIHQQL